MVRKNKKEKEKEKELRKKAELLVMFPEVGILYKKDDKAENKQK